MPTVSALSVQGKLLSSEKSPFIRRKILNSMQNHGALQIFKNRICMSFLTIPTKSHTGAVF